MKDKTSRAKKTIPIFHTPQIVPSQVCLSCDICCRFPERDSSYRPFFTESEIQQAIESGIDAVYFSDSAGCQVEPVPNPSGEGFLCPAFDHNTFHCRIYEVRPMDCQLYPFVVMWDKSRQVVQLGWDTKCPFLFDQSTLPDIPSNSSMTEHLSTTLPITLQRVSQTMVETVESAKIMNIFSSAPQLVMEYQEDVVTIQELPKLTHMLLFNTHKPKSEE